MKYQYTEDSARIFLGTRNNKCAPLLRFPQQVGSLRTEGCTHGSVRAENPGWERNRVVHTRVLDLEICLAKVGRFA